MGMGRRGCDALTSASGPAPLVLAVLIAAMICLQPAGKCIPVLEFYYIKQETRFMASIHHQFASRLLVEALSVGPFVRNLH